MKIYSILLCLCFLPFSAFSQEPTVIGTTNYDQQSYSGVSRRIVKNSSGEISATWIKSALVDPYADRKNGYSHYKDGKWEEQVIKPSNKLGFGSICMNASQEELIVSHCNVEFSYYTVVQKSKGFGQGGWTESRPIDNNNALSNSLYAIYHKVASSGNHIYVIAQGINNAKNGLIRPVYFAQSTDGGTTFSDFNLLPDEDTLHFPNHEAVGDSYSIDAYDNYVAIISGGDFSDLTLWKSEDYGQTFKRTIIEAFPLANWKKSNWKKSDINNDGLADTLLTNDNAMDVILDLKGNVHVFYGRKYFIQEADSGERTVQKLYPRQPKKQIIYWNELTKNSRAIAGAPDTDGDGMITSGSNESFNDYNMGFAGQPTTGIDKNGNLYVVYMAYVERDTTNSDLSEQPGQLFHNLFYIRSCDTGKTWSYPINITNTTYVENAFPSMARLVNSSLSIVWQRDIEPGTNRFNNDRQTENEIVTTNYGFLYPCNNTVSIEEKEGDPLTLKIYPNPIQSDILSLLINYSKNSSVKISITNTLGQLVSEEQQFISNGSTLLSKNISSLSPGLYFINLSTSDGNLSTKKLTISQ